MHNKGCTLIVTVDNGISAVEEADFAASLGMDLIITDHHLPPETLPKAVAVVDPLPGGRPQPPFQGSVRRRRSLQALRCAGRLPAGGDAGLLRRPCRRGHRGRRDAPDRREPHSGQGGPAPAAAL